MFHFWVLVADLVAKSSLDLVKGVGDLTVRNQAGRLPLEIPHNSILSDKKMKQAVNESVPNATIAKYDAI